MLTHSFIGPHYAQIFSLNNADIFIWPPDYRCRQLPDPNNKLASCPWGLVTVNGLDLLTEMYAIIMLEIMSVGPMAVAGGAVTHAMTDGRKARKYYKDNRVKYS